MLRYADAIVKRGVDKLIDAIGHSPEPQTKNAETPQPQKSMGNDTDCAPQTTGNTTNCGLTEQTISMTQTVCLRIVYAEIKNSGLRRSVSRCNRIVDQPGLEIC